MKTLMILTAAAVAVAGVASANPSFRTAPAMTHATAPTAPTVPFAPGSNRLATALPDGATEGNINVCTSACPALKKFKIEGSGNN